MKHITTQARALQPVTPNSITVGTEIRHWVTATRNRNAYQQDAVVVDMEVREDGALYVRTQDNSGLRLWWRAEQLATLLVGIYAARSTSRIAKVGA